MAPALGALAAGFRLRKIPLGLALVLGAGAWVWVWRGRPDLSLWGGLGATCGLFALGYGVSAALGLGRMGWAGLALLTWALIGAPAGYWLPDVAPWSPKVTACLLLWSPAALAIESAGGDFLRLPAVYEPFGADALGPSLWIAWGSLAGWGALVVGCLVAQMGRFRPRGGKSHNGRSDGY